jgi:hypothetical protein
VRGSTVIAPRGVSNERRVAAARTALGSCITNALGKDDHGRIGRCKRRGEALGSPVLASMTPQSSCRGRFQRVKINSGC